MNWRDDPRWAYLLVNCATLLWGSNIILGRALHDQVGPLTLTAVRFFVAALFFRLVLARSLAGPLPASEASQGRNWIILLGMALTGVIAFPALLYLALKYTTATNAALINGTSPLITMILAAVLLREQLTPNRLGGALVSLIGVTVIIAGGTFQTLSHFQPNIGDLIAFFNAILWGLYSILGRLAMRTRPALETTAFSTWLALPLLLLAAAFEWRVEPPTLSAPVVLAGIYIGIFPTFLAFLAWNEGVRRVGPARAMAFYNMFPVYGALMGALLLGEKPGWLHLLGGGLVILGGIAAASAGEKFNWRRSYLAR